MSPVQRGNEEWVKERGVGIIVPNLEELPIAIEKVMTSPDYRIHAVAEMHRGVFEAVDFVCSLTDRTVTQPLSQAGVAA
jgi:hypothetical protein